MGRCAVTKGMDLAGNVARLRKAAGLTQGELAGHLGVTKASVSKWETGQSMPDIALLPQIATRFATSIDELVGYAPQMPAEAIREEISRLRVLFADEGPGEALAEARELVRGYYSCPGLLVEMATLFVNHLGVAATEEERDALVQEACGLCQRVRELDATALQVRQATAVEAMLQLMGGNAEAALELLGESALPALGEDTLVASAYQMLGQPGKAQEALQVAVLQALILVLQSLGQLAALWAGDLARVQEAWRRTLAVVDAFEMDSLYLNVAATYLAFAQAHLAAGDADGAIGCLERYVRACERMEFPLALHGDDFFDHVEGWLYDLEAGPGAPRNEALVKADLLKGVAENPMLAPLSGDPRFKRIVAALEAALA